MSKAPSSILLFSLLSLTIGGCCAPPSAGEPEYGRALPLGASALIALGPNDERPNFGPQWYERDSIMPALDRSIDWTSLSYARQFFPIEGVSQNRALASLERFRELLLTSNSASDFDDAIEREFTVYKSAGWDGRGGGVLFTGYYTPIFDGSFTRSEKYRFPLYGLPEDLEKSKVGVILGRRTATGLEPYPSRRAIEAGGLLEGAGLELIWLGSALDAYIAHVNGSAFVDVGEEDLARFGYAGKNGKPYTSLGGELIDAGQLTRDEVSLATIRRWAIGHPGEVQEFLHRNESYVFFTPISGTPHGSLNVAVTAERTLATDKTLFPRGAITFVSTNLPTSDGRYRPFQQIMLDQDTGGAIRTAGRADIYVGIGPEAELTAGSTRAEGQLYYLFLRETGNDFELEP